MPSPKRMLPNTVARFEAICKQAVESKGGQGIAIKFASRIEATNFRQKIYLARRHAQESPSSPLFAIECTLKEQVDGFAILLRPDGVRFKTQEAFDIATGEPVELHIQDYASLKTTEQLAQDHLLDWALFYQLKGHPPKEAKQLAERQKGQVPVPFPVNVLDANSRALHAYAKKIDVDLKAVARMYDSINGSRWLQVIEEREREGLGGSCDG